MIYRTMSAVIFIPNVNFWGARTLKTEESAIFWDNDFDTFYKDPKWWWYSSFVGQRKSKTELTTAQRMGCIYSQKDSRPVCGLATWFCHKQMIAILYDVRVDRSTTIDRVWRVTKDKLEAHTNAIRQRKQKRKY
jgi:hypothetical protein